jgi:hypothetical protein
MYQVYFNMYFFNVYKMEICFGLSMRNCNSRDFEVILNAVCIFLGILIYDMIFV